MQDFLRVARIVVEEAAVRLRAANGAAKTIEHKGAIDLVTETDRELEDFIVRRLRAEFPQHAIVAEEASGGAAPARPPADEYVWFLDPLDGTTNFAHAYPQFSVSLALARGEEMLVAVVADPMRGELFCAERGAGAVCNDAPIRVSDVTALGDALLGTGFPYDRRERADFYLAFMRDFMLRSQGIRRLGSAALDLCSVACGRLDGFWEWKLHPWDIAAGTLIVREAGGAVSSFGGAALDLFGDQTLASNGHIHGAMIEVLRARLDA
jgi:myo-inositol-1(or 4)-monophosphatase